MPKGSLPSLCRSWALLKASLKHGRERAEPGSKVDSLKPFSQPASGRNGSRPLSRKITLGTAEAIRQDRFALNLRSHFWRNEIEDSTQNGPDASSEMQPVLSCPPEAAVCGLGSGSEAGCKSALGSGLRGPNGLR